MKTESEILSIEVKPGWKKGTKITFTGKGNQQWNQLPADLVFVVDERPHDVYRRDGNDLVAEARVTLAEALGGTVVVLAALDGRELAVDVGGGEEDAPVVCPGYELVVPMEGMPIAREPGRHGSLRSQDQVRRRVPGPANARLAIADQTHPRTGSRRRRLGWAAAAIDMVTWMCVSRRSPENYRFPSLCTRMCTLFVRVSVY
jgi:DnaJ-class molecular chaperone